MYKSKKLTSFKANIQTNRRELTECACRRVYEGSERSGGSGKRQRGSGQ